MAVVLMSAGKILLPTDIACPSQYDTLVPVYVDTYRGEEWPREEAQKTDRY
jgi:hypothetical protein